MNCFLSGDGFCQVGAMRVVLTIIEGGTLLIDDPLSFFPPASMSVRDNTFSFFCGGGVHVDLLSP